MATSIAAEVARVLKALDTPTLSLLDRKSATVALPVFTHLFTDTMTPIPVDRFHARLGALLSEMEAEGYDVPGKEPKKLANQWVREQWLYRDPGENEETYRLTGAAEQALSFVDRVTGAQLNVSRSRIETMNRVIADAAMAAKPDRDQRKRQLTEEIARLTNEYERLNAGGEMEVFTDHQLLEQFSSVLHEINDLPSDFRRVEESMQEMKRSVIKRFNDEDRPIGEVLDSYLEQSRNLLLSTAAGRAFEGALDLLRQRDILSTMKKNLTTIVEHPVASDMKPEEIKQLSTAVDVIRRGIKSVTTQRTQLSKTVADHIKNYDHIKNKELDLVLRGIEGQIRTWMQDARPRDHVPIDLIPEDLDLDDLKLKMFNPDHDRPPEPLADVTDTAPPATSATDLWSISGPSLSELRRRVQAELDTQGSIESAAALFNALPDNLRRPVEVIGLMHVLAGLGAEYDFGHRESVQVIRPDRTTRTFRLPATQLIGDDDSGAHDD